MSPPGALIARAFPGILLLLSVAGCSDSIAPEPVDPDLFVAVDAGDSHTCALRGDGALFCWGSNGWGELGVGGFDNEHALPTRVQSTLDFGGVAAGSYHTCALTTDGEAHCWGSTAVGALGTGESDEGMEFAPVPVATDLRFTAIDVGWRRTCALTADGEAWCWGSNRWGELGTGSQDEFASTPSRVETSVRFTSITVGWAHTCGLDGDGRAWCWGSNRFGELGAAASETCQGEYACSQTPVAVEGDRRFTALSAGDWFTCGVESSGAAFCWGSGWTGNLGNGSTDDQPVPVPVAGGLSWESVDAGARACGVTTDGAAWCWGRAHLGDGSTEDSPVPVAVALSEPFDAISAGGAHTCGLTRAGAVWCWGSNGSGQLGDGSPTLGSTTPVPVDLSEGGTP